MHLLLVEYSRSRPTKVFLSFFLQKVVIVYVCDVHYQLSLLHVLSVYNATLLEYIYATSYLSKVWQVILIRNTINLHFTQIPKSFVTIIRPVIDPRPTFIVVDDVFPTVFTFYGQVIR